MNNKNYLRFTEGEITVYCGDHALANVHSSLRQAREIAGSSRRANIMYINTVFSTRKMLEATRQELMGRVNVPVSGEKSYAIGAREAIFFQHVIIGDLCKYLDEIRETIEANDIKYLIVNSWEFANRSYGYKEKVLFGLMNIANELGVSVLIHSQANMTEAVAGKMHRTGLGKLAAVCDAIHWVDCDAILEELKDDDGKVIMLSDRKINDLTYPRSDSGVSAGGELILPGNLMEKEVLEVELVQ